MSTGIGHPIALPEAPPADALRRDQARPELAWFRKERRHAASAHS
jgi:hypothetical protein